MITGSEERRATGRLTSSSGERSGQGDSANQSPDASIHLDGRNNSED